jgi:hypothetical protein
MTVYLIEEQYEKVIEADKASVPILAIEQFLNDIKGIDEVLSYELSQYNKM